MNKERNNTMGITVNGNVEKITNFEENGVQINVYGSSENFNLIYNELEKLKSFAKDDEKREIANAQQCITDKDENKLIQSLKKLQPFIGRVASSVTASVIVAYMKAKGIIA